MLNVNSQLGSFLILLITGMVMGVFFDFYRVIRGKVKFTKIAKSIGDLCFWILVAMVATPLIFWSTWLELRLYVWLALMLGVGFYFSVFSKNTLPFLAKIWSLLAWLPRQGAKLILEWRLVYRKLTWSLRRKLVKRD